MSTPPDIQPHADAILAALAGIGLSVGDGVAPPDFATVKKYAVLYTDPGQSLSESLADQRTGFAMSFQVTCVGPTPEQVRWVIQKVRAALFPKLTVAGRMTWRAEELGGPPIQRDDDVTPPLYFLPVQYRLQSTS